MVMFLESNTGFRGNIDLNVALFLFFLSVFYANNIFFINGTSTPFDPKVPVLQVIYKRCLMFTRRSELRLEVFGGGPWSA